MSEAPLLFLDANALASPITRTLLIVGARADGLRWTWSKHVEVEADRHTRGGASRTSNVRQKILGSELSPTARQTEGLVTGTLEDRQVMADAIHAGARYLITSDVADFAFGDLVTHGMSAVNPDYFMAARFTEQAYMEGVDLLAAVQKNPSRTAKEIHRMLGRRHPRLVTKFAGAYDTTPVQADADQPSTIFRGVACIRARHISMARRVYNTDCARSTWLSEPGDNVSGAGDGSRHGDQFSSEPIRLSTRSSIGPGVEAANGEFTLLGLLLPKGQRNQLKDLQREHRRIIQIEGTFYSGRS